MEKILIVSNYYPPEKGAAANRIGQLAIKLKENGYSVSVVCPLANYPKGEIFPEYKGKFSTTETIDGITVSRLWIYPSKSKNVIKRILSIASFSVCLKMYLLFGNIPKKVVVQSPPLLLSFISVFVLWLRRRKIILNVSDLWPSAAIELGVLKKGSLSHSLLLGIEKFIYRKATVVLGQSEEIIAHVRSIYPEKPCHLYRNFPDHQSRSVIPDLNSGSIKIFYAGLLGVAQGVFEAIQKMALDGLNVELHIFGDGAEKNDIESYISSHPEKHIHFHGMLNRDELISRLPAFDVAFVPLTTRIYGSVPSKIFEYSALGFPILYFGGGEGNDIVRENELGWVAEVGDFDELNKVLITVAGTPHSRIAEMKKEIASRAAENFSLDRQMKSLVEKGIF